MRIRANAQWSPGREIDSGIVVLDGALIADVLPDDGSPVDLDLRDCLLTPAWVNPHTHLAMNALRGLGGRTGQRGNVIEDVYFAAESRMTPADVRAFARMGAYDVLLTGTGTVWEHYYGGRALADGLADVGLCGVVSPTLQDLDGPGQDGWAAALEATETIATDAELADAGIVAALGPHATDTVSDALWERILEMRDRLDLAVHLHVAQSPEEVQRAGDQTPVQRLRATGALDRGTTLLVHMVYVTDDDLACLDPARHRPVFCPRSQVQFAFPAPVHRWRQAGLKPLLATDAGVSNDGMDVQQELAWVAGGPSFSLARSAAFDAFHDGDPADALRQARTALFDAQAPVSGPAALLDLITGAPANLHPKLPVGRIAAGYRANLAAWDLTHPALWPARDPLRGMAYGATAPALHTLFVNGRPIGDVGDVGAVLRTEAYRAHRQEADARLDALFARMETSR